MVDVPRGESEGRTRQKPTSHRQDIQSLAESKSFRRLLERVGVGSGALSDRSVVREQHGVHVRGGVLPRMQAAFGISSVTWAGAPNVGFSYYGRRTSRKRIVLVFDSQGAGLCYPPDECIDCRKAGQLAHVAREQVVNVTTRHMW